MTDINIIFGRHLLTLVQEDMRTFAPHIKIWKDAWVICAGRGQWTFYGPDNYYWHGNAANAFEARANGWRAWLEKYSPLYAKRYEE